MSYLVAGVGSIQLFDPSSNALILTSKTLTDEGINFGSTAEEARGGMGNALLGKYYHDTSFGLTLTDQLFDLQYLALNCGGAIQATSDVLTNEQVTVLLAQAQKEADTIVAEGEAEYMKILSDAYNDKDKADFYSFVRQLDAVKATLKDGDNTIVLDKNSPIAEIFY